MQKVNQAKIEMRPQAWSVNLSNQTLFKTSKLHIYLFELTSFENESGFIDIFSVNKFIFSYDKKLHAKLELKKMMEPILEEIIITFSNNDHDCPIFSHFIMNIVQDN